MNSLGFHHLALFARDVERVASFYREVFELPELERFLNPDGSLRSIWLSVKSGGSKADGFIAVEVSSEVTRGAAGFGMLALRIEPAERERVRHALQQRHVAIERETGWTMYVRDPEGNLVGLSHHPHSTP